LPANRVVEKILRSLIDDFENVVCVSEESKDLSTLTVEELVRSLEVHEQRKQEKKVEPLNLLLQMNGEARNTQGRRRHRGGIGSDPSGRSRGQKEEKEQNWRGRGRRPWRGGRSSNSNVECFKYGKYGHYAKDYYSDKCFNCDKVKHFAKYYRSKSGKEETINPTKEVKEKATLLMMVRSLGVEHKQVENSSRRTSSMENSTRRLSIVDHSTRQSSRVDRSTKQPSRLHRLVRHVDSSDRVVESVNTLDNMVEHEANSINLVGHLHSLIKLMK